MTKELKNAVLRLRKLQDAAFAGKLDCVSTDIGLSFYNRHYAGGDHATVDIVVCIHNEDGEIEKHLMFSMSDRHCYKVGEKGDNVWSIAKILHEISTAVDYPV